MNQNNPSFQPALDNDNDDENEISIMEILFRYLKYWKWFVLSILFSMVIAFIYFRYTVPVYNVTSTIILKHEKDRRSSMAGLGSLDGLELMGGLVVWIMKFL